MLINRNFRWLWLGNTVSQFGDMVFVTSSLIWVASLFESSPYAPLMAGGLTALSASVALVVAPFAGAWVDRHPDKRRIMLRTDLFRLLVIILIAGVAALPSSWIPVWSVTALLAVVVVIVALASQFFNPARFIVVGDVVPADQRGRASSYTQASTAVAVILGPVLAAPLTVFAGVSWALLIDAATFFISYFAIRNIRTQFTDSSTSGSTKPTSDEGFRAGLRFVRNDPTVKTVMATGVVVMAGAGAVTALNIFFVGERLQLDPSWYGYLSAALGGGMLLGAFSAGFIGDRFGHARLMRFALVGCAIGLFAYSRIEFAWLAMVLIAGYGVAAGVVETAVGPLIYQSTPRSHLGRVSSVLVPAFRSASMCSAAAAGAVAGLLPQQTLFSVLGQDFGRTDSIFTAAAVLIGLGAVYAWFTLPDGVADGSHGEDPSELDSGATRTTNSSAS